MSDFFRFPHTPHIAWLASGSPRDDKVLSLEDAETLLAGEVVIEEKIDGANLGFSIGSDGLLCAQNRGQYLLPPFTGQFAQLGKWLELHQGRLLGALTQSSIVFGEWCAARHSLNYDQLPDWWLMFDVYERETERFWSTVRRNELSVLVGVSVVPCVYQGRVTMAQLKKHTLKELSRFRQGDAEGVIVRSEDTMWLQKRAKLVRPNFTQSITQHWRNRAVEWNRITYAQD